MTTRVCDILCSEDRRVTTSQDSPLTSVSVQQENNPKDLLEEDSDKSSLSRRARVLSSSTEEFQQNVILSTLQFRPSTLHRHRRLQATRIRSNDLSFQS